MVTREYLYVTSRIIRYREQQEGKVYQFASREGISKSILINKAIAYFLSSSSGSDL